MGFLSRFDELHQLASQAAGDLADFGDSEYEQPLRLLLGDYDEYAKFSDEGAEFVVQDIVGNLTGRLIEEQAFKEHSAFAKAPVAAPLVIIGMPRTGTTMLHRLIALDPALQTLPMWLAALPMPRPPQNTWENNPVFQQVQQSLEQVYERTPLLKAMHPQSAGAADECRIALNHSFWSPGMMSSFADVPNYSRWVFETDASYAYQRYQKTLALIAAGNSQPWLLKSPDHIFDLASLIKVFPDARIVFTHRDPVEAMTSFGNIMFHARSLVQHNLKPEQLKNNFPGYWGKAMDKMEQHRADINPAQMLDLHLNEINANPVAAVERIYDYFGMAISGEALSAWRRQVSSDPRVGHGDGKKFALADFSATAEDIKASVGSYWQRYQAVAANRAQSP